MASQSGTPRSAGAGATSSSSPAAPLHTPSSAPPMSSHQASSSKVAQGSPPASAPAYGPAAGAGWPYRARAAPVGQGWRTGYTSEASPSQTPGANAVGISPPPTGPRPGVRTFGLTNWVRGPDGNPVFAPAAAAAVREAEGAAWKAHEAVMNDQEEETEEEIETVGLTPRDIVEEFKRAGHFDSLRKELLSSFTASPLLPSMQSFVENHLVTLLDSSPERRQRLAGLDKRLQNMEMCKEIEDNTDLMRRVVASVRGTGDGLQVGPSASGEGKKKGEDDVEAETGEPRDSAAPSEATTSTPSFHALLSADSSIGLSLQRKVRELVKAERERREEDNEGEDNSEAEGKNTPAESARNGSMTPATPMTSAGQGRSSFAAGGATPVTAGLPSATPSATAFAEAPSSAPAGATVVTAAAAAAVGDDEEQDMDMD